MIKRVKPVNTQSASMTQIIKKTFWKIELNQRKREWFNFIYCDVVHCFRTYLHTCLLDELYTQKRDSLLEQGIKWIMQQVLKVMSSNPAAARQCELLAKLPKEWMNGWRERVRATQIRDQYCTNFVPMLEHSFSPKGVQFLSQKEAQACRITFESTTKS